MKVLIIGDKPNIDLLDLNIFKKENKNIEFITAEENITSKKDDIIFIMKELKNYSFFGKKNLFLENKININKKDFSFISFDSLEVNINKIKFLINIYLN
jgi:hypothetical protein